MLELVVYITTPIIYPIGYRSDAYKLLGKRHIYNIAIFLNGLIAYYF
jgi:hypothetical protein